jgi:hypothetical protein
LVPGRGIVEAVREDLDESERVVEWTAGLQSGVTSELAWRGRKDSRGAKAFQDFRPGD